ncbi:hypothetical protein CDS [Bradyrhizobium sp.]|nr:hypothetical protein CDS [Bradyrhizobium sp.]
MTNSLGFAPAAYIAPVIHLFAGPRSTQPVDSKDLETFM